MRGVPAPPPTTRALHLLSPSPPGHEAANAVRCEADFSSLEHTTLVIPGVLWAKKRVLVMECEPPPPSVTLFKKKSLTNISM